MISFLIIEVKNVLAQSEMSAAFVSCVWPGRTYVSCIRKAILHVVSTSSWFYSAGEISILQDYSKQCHVIKTCTRDKNDKVATVIS